MRGTSVKEGTEYSTRYVERAGTIAQLKRYLSDFVGERWGYDRVTEEERISVVDLSALRDLAMRHLRGFETAIKLQFEQFVRYILRPSIDIYFLDLTGYLEEFRGYLQDTNLEADRLNALLASISQLRHDVEDLLIDAQALSSGLAGA